MSSGLLYTFIRTEYNTRTHFNSCLSCYLILGDEFDCNFLYLGKKANNTKNFMYITNQGRVFDVIKCFGHSARGVSYLKQRLKTKLLTLCLEFIQFHRMNAV